MGPKQAIAELRRAPGELSFEARIGPDPRRIWFRAPGATFTPSADAALAACLMPAMRGGGTLTLNDPISPRLLRTQREFQGVQRAWSMKRELGDPPLREVEVRAPLREVAPRPPTGRVAALFSGGVDSWSTVLDNPDLTDLIFVLGVDLLPARIDEHATVAGEIEQRLLDAAEELGLTLHVLETNVRELSDPLIRWERYFTSPLIAAGLFFEPLFDRVLIAGDSDYATQDARGGNRLVTRLMNTENLEIVQDGGRFDRMERTRRIATHPVVRKSLRVCWENLDSAYNCGRCRKCLMTMASLDAIGALDRIESFPGAIDLEQLSKLPARQVASLTLREDLLDMARAESGKPELVSALEAAVAGGKEELGLPPEHRGREREIAVPAESAASAEGQQIADLRSVPGELSFEVRIGGEAKRIWFRTETPVTASADAALAACLLPAMRSGGSLTLSDPVSPRVLRNQRELQAVQCAWSQTWELAGEPLHEIEVSAPTRVVSPREPTGRVAAFFSGGVDSWAVVLDNPDLTDLIFVRGIDLLPDRIAEHAKVADEVERRVREAVEALGLTLHVVETNVRELSDPLVPWEAYSAAPLAAVALMFEELFDRVLIAGDTDYETQDALGYGAIWTVDQLWSSEWLEIVDAGGRLSREQRVRLLAESPVARASLRVCWENRDGSYNCGRCGKCVLTMISLEALGVLPRMITFPPLDTDLLAGFEMSQTIQLVLWEDLLQSTREAGRPDLETAVGEYVDRGRVALGREPDHRVRAPTDEPAAPPPALAQPPLLADAATAAAVAEAPAIALLVGSYDGSGNFGDIAQLEAALALLAPLSADLLVLTVLERGTADDASAERPPRGIGHVVYYDPEGHGAPGLEPLGPPAALAHGACYLYGGGYLNPDWGARKLGMLAAAESLLAGGGAARITRIATGLQVDGAWVEALPSDQRMTLRGFDLLGGRDPESTAGLAALAPRGTVLESGDDALAVLPRPAIRATTAERTAALRVNIHFAEHPWVTPDPGRMLNFYAGLLARLAELAGGALELTPLIAYADPRTDERPDMERLRAACAERGIELGEPRLVRAATLGPSADLGAAELTLSCSYHVALTSLLLGVPAILLADMPYYEQKAEGLSAPFGLPPQLSAHSGEDSDEVARRVFAALREPDQGARLRAGIEAGGDAMRARRIQAEAAALARLGAGALAAAAAARAAERDAHRQLGEVLGSRSWRIGEPLRRAGRAARDRLRRS
jgi:hypothetical protein